jgi:ComF family protein
VCEGCLAELPWIENACARCANPVVARLPGDIHCAACQLNPLPFEAAVAPLAYAFPVDAAIKSLKFRRKLFYVPAFAHVLVESMQRLPDGVDALLPVPLHWRRQALRGFNQATELTKPIGRMTGIRLLKNVIRSRATPFQSGLAAEYRQRNLRGAFSVRGAVGARHVLIVDDVITTGETCRQLANVLLDAGVEKVSVLAIARA